MTKTTFGRTAQVLEEILAGGNGRRKKSALRAKQTAVRVFSHGLGVRETVCVILARFVPRATSKNRQNNGNGLALARCIADTTSGGRP